MEKKQLRNLINDFPALKNCRIEANDEGFKCIDFFNLDKATIDGCSEVLANISRSVNMIQSTHNIVIHACNGDHASRVEFVNELANVLTSIIFDKSYARGAAMGALGMFPAEVAGKIGEHLSRQDAGSLSQVNRAAAKSAKEEEQRSTEIDEKTLKKHGPRK